MAQTFEFDDASRVERLTGTLHAPGATPGDVLTVNADKSISPAPGGGSQPGAIRLVGPYTVGFADFAADVPNGFSWAEIAPRIAGQVIHGVAWFLTQAFNDSNIGAFGGGPIPWDEVDPNNSGVQLTPTNVDLVNVQSQGQNMGGLSLASYFDCPDDFLTNSGPNPQLAKPNEPSGRLPLLCDGSADLYLFGSGALALDGSAGSIDFYLYTSTLGSP